MMGPITTDTSALPAARRFFQRRRRGMPLLIAGLMLVAVLLLPVSAFATSRIKDIADVEGVRDNQLVGYGLVVGLNGTGDNLKNALFTQQSLIGMLERLGVNTRDTKLETKNVAAVMVTANLPPFGRQGTRIDVSVARAGRRQEPPGRHAAGHAAARRRRRGLCGGPGPGRHRRLHRQRRRRHRHRAACPPRAASPTAPSSSARSASP